jgi:DNA repair protein RadC
MPECRRVPEDERRRVGTIHDPHTVFSLLGPKASRLKCERAWLLLLDHHYFLASEGVIGEGKRDEVEVDLDWALACVRLPETPYCVLAHNHPNGQAWPSVDDENLTRALGRVAARQRVTLLDHVVLGRNQYFSFAEGQLWQVTKTRS